MSILIKGMEMPTSCSRCAMFDAGSNGDPDWCNVMHQVPEYKTCPLVEIPPHGRLIDADALELMFADIDDAPYSGFDGIEPFYSADDAARIIRLAPTIIPAEEGE